MVIEIGRHPRSRKPSPPPETWSALRELPARKPEKPAPHAGRVRWELVQAERYEVRVGTRVVGYIDIVGAVFVVLEGSRYDRAVESLQTLVFGDAIAALTRPSTFAM